MGIGFNTPAGFAAASYHIMAHAFTKSMLFIATGVLINAAGTKEISGMIGVAWKSRIAGAAFLVGALSLIGIPLFAGFPSKFYLAEAAIHDEQGAWIAFIFLAFSTFLNALYYVPTLYKFYSTKGTLSQAIEGGSWVREKSPATPVLFGLIGANIALGVFYLPIMSLLHEGFEWLG